MYISTHTDKNINSATRNNLVDTGFSRRVSCAARREAPIFSFNFNDGFLDPRWAKSLLNQNNIEDYFSRFKKLRLETFRRYYVDEEND